MAEPRLSISKFFRNTLGAPLSNSRWSWGAVNAATDQLFLRVWDDELDCVDGARAVVVYDPTWESSSLGQAERRRHVELMRNGTDAFGLLCTAKNARPSGHRTIASYDAINLRKFGRLLEHKGYLYAEIVGEVPVEGMQSRSELRATSENEVNVDAAEAQIQRRTDIGPTGKRNLLNAHRGQGLYRQNLERIEQQCRVTGVLDRRHLRASHIKPWALCDDREKLDGFNGLLFSPHIGHLFDRGYLSFSDSGEVLVAKDLNPAVLEKWGTALPSNVGAFTPEQCQYLEYHRINVFGKTSGGRRGELPLAAAASDYTEDSEPPVANPA